MTALERNDLIQALVQNYVIEKYKNIVFQRENAEAYTYTKGTLMGACMALELDIKETKEDITIVTRSKNKVIVTAKFQE
ncbi:MULTISPECIES: hypothetical protein [Clostridium]|uniref:hypothetical protein n=1 Tax=Clostridium TaxID=1485 RepID=UPI00069EF2D1|nr:MULTISPECIES: hypothetical protein [Clostridium]KOF55700.1 hypothetical protein AGR56_17835 [Clostridium sp. DMHC 10]MCD2348991.1 hypothetical protein [Clostridium guangxiense]